MASFETSRSRWHINVFRWSQGTFSLICTYLHFLLSAIQICWRWSDYEPWVWLVDPKNRISLLYIEGVEMGCSVVRVEGGNDKIGTFGCGIGPGRIRRSVITLRYTIQKELMAFGGTVYSIWSFVDDIRRHRTLHPHSFVCSSASNSVCFNYKINEILCR